MVTLLHTSDVHIGEYAREAYRLAGLAAVVDLALAHDVDALLIAGDLFDNSRVSDQSVTGAFEQLARLRIPVCISMGNHDSWETPSIYDRHHPRVAGAHVRFLAAPEGEHVLFEDLDLSVWSRGMLAHTPENVPLLGYEPLPGARWQVVMAHGHYISEAERGLCSSPIYPAEIAALRCDYLALGHWHRRADVSHGDTVAFYSGSPSDEFIEHHSANLVRLEAGRPPAVTHLPIELPEDEAGPGRRPGGIFA
jgi:DNA repair exonuclease SbcCD nuclease subunit